MKVLDNLLFYFITLFPPLLLVLLQLLQATLVGQVFDFEVLEGCLEAVAVGAGRHHSHHHRGVVLQPAVAHRQTSRKSPLHRVCAPP